MTGIYARVSTAEQAKGYSIDEQNDRMKKFCEAHGWSFRYYTDAGFSGADTERPSLRRLVEDVENKKIDRVLVFKLDRLSRSQKDTLNLIEDCFLKNGCDFVSMSESFDTSTPFGKAIIGILSTFAQLEREVIKERMTMGKEARIRSGKWTGGITPFGYDYDRAEGKLIVNEYEAMQIRELFERYAAGDPRHGIMADFNAKGYSLRNNPWAMWSINYILENRVYCGFIRFKDGWIRGTHEPIISEDLFEKVAAVIADGRRRYAETGVPAGGKANISTLLGGLIFCGCCGNKFGKRSAGSPPKRFWEYCCYSRIKSAQTRIKDPSCKNKAYRVEELEKIVLDEIRKLRFEPIQQKATEDNESKIALMKAEVESIDRQVSRFLDLYGLGRFSVDQLDKKIKPLEDRKASLQAEIEVLKTRAKMPLKQAAEIIESFDVVLEKGTFAEQRRAVQLLIDRIVINGEEIDIYWNF